MPLVDGHYRTLTGAPNTGIGGSSYGGVAALYALPARPGEFGFGLIESPTLRVGRGQPVRDTSLRVVIDADALHTEAAWEKRLPEALQFLFEDWRAQPPAP